MPFNQRRVRQGDPIKAEDYNYLLDEVHRLGRLTVAPPLEMTDMGSGVEIRVADIAGGEIILGKLDADMTADGSAEMSIWSHNGTSIVDTGETITVYDWLLDNSQTIATDQRVIAGTDSRNDRKYIIGARCPNLDST